MTKIDLKVIQVVADLLKARSGGHFEAVHEQSDLKFYNDAETAIRVADRERGIRIEKVHRFPDGTHSEIQRPTVESPKDYRYISDWNPVEETDESSST